MRKVFLCPGCDSHWSIDVEPYDPDENIVDNLWPQRALCLFCDGAEESRCVVVSEPGAVAPGYSSRL